MEMRHNQLPEELQHMRSLSEEEIKLVEGVITKLRSQCHHRGCKSVHICPEMCKCRSKRRWKLNLNTAMLWLTANLLNMAIKELDTRRTVIHRIWKEVELLRSVMSYHKASNQEYHRLLGAVYGFLNKLYWQYDIGVVKQSYRRVMVCPRPKGR